MAAGMTELVRREMFALIRTLEDAGAVTSTSFSLAALPDLDITMFEDIGRYLGLVHDGSKWWIADLLLEAEERFGEAAYQVAEATRRSERTLLNWVWVARRVPRSRRREGLTFSHHVLVAPLELQEQITFLDAAEAERWSSRQLKAAINEQRTLGPAQEDECADLDDIAADLRDRLRDCYGDVDVQITGAGFQYAERIP